MVEKIVALIIIVSTKANMTIKIMTNKIKLETWIKGLYKKNQCQVIERDKETIVKLSEWASGWFGIGVHLKDESPFLGVQGAFYPWFVDSRWDECIIDLEDSYIYLSSTSEDGEKLCIGIMVREKRLDIFWDNKMPEDIDIRRIVFKDERVMVSNSASLTLPLLLVEDIQLYFDGIRREEEKYYIEIDEYEGYEESV